MRYVDPQRSIVNEAERLRELELGASQGRWIMFPDEEAREEFLVNIREGVDHCPGCGESHPPIDDPELLEKVRESALVVPRLAEIADGEDLSHGLPLVAFVLIGDLAATAGPAIEMTINVMGSIGGPGGEQITQEELEERIAEKNPINEQAIENVDMDELERRLLGGDEQ